MGGTPAAVSRGNMEAVLRSSQFPGHCNIGTTSDLRGLLQFLVSYGKSRLLTALGTQTPVPPVRETNNYQEQEAKIKEITLSHLEL